jgi:DNA-binding FadR family transcriptional regulator
MAAEQRSHRVRSEMFAAVRVRRASDDVIRQIVDRIRAGRIREGDLLPGERALAERFEVSRPTVRLAIGALVEAGILEVSPGRGGGPRVRSIWIPDGLMSPRWEPQADDLFEWLEARRVLETRVARLAAVRGTDEHFAALRRSIDLQRTNVSDRGRVLQMEVQFHRQMWRAAANRTLEEMLVQLFDRLEVAFDMVLRTADDTALAIDIHERTLDALRGAEGDAIDRIMDEHLCYTEDIVQEAVGRRMNSRLPAFLRGDGRTVTTASHR